jgi:hypothetical protein
MPSFLSKSEVVRGLASAKNEFAAVLRLSFDRFCSQCGYRGVAINPRTLDIAVKSWLDALDRYSAYHDDIDPDPYKIAGFLMYWVAKTKPAYIVMGHNLGITENRDTEFLVDKYDTVNETFVLRLAMDFLDIDWRRVPPETSWQIVYLLFYREVNPKHLMLTLELLGRSLR